MDSVLSAANERAAVAMAPIDSEARCRCLDPAGDILPAILQQADAPSLLRMRMVAICYWRLGIFQDIARRRLRGRAVTHPACEQLNDLLPQLVLLERGVSLPPLPGGFLNEPTRYSHTRGASHGHHNVVCNDYGMAAGVHTMTFRHMTDGSTRKNSVNCPPSFGVMCEMRGLGSHFCGLYVDNEAQRLFVRVIPRKAGPTLKEWLPERKERAMEIARQSVDVVRAQTFPEHVLVLTTAIFRRSHLTSRNEALLSR